jgi:hypothetical protein
MPEQIPSASLRVDNASGKEFEKYIKLPIIVLNHENETES